MVEQTISPEDFSEYRKRVSEWRRFSRVFFAKGAVAIGLVILLLFFFHGYLRTFVSAL